MIYIGFIESLFSAERIAQFYSPLLRSFFFIKLEETRRAFLLMAS